MEESNFPVQAVVPLTAKSRIRFETRPSSLDLTRKGLANLLIREIGESADRMRREKLHARFAAINVRTSCSIIDKRRTYWRYGEGTDEIRNVIEEQIASSAQAVSQKPPLIPYFIRDNLFCRKIP